MIRLLCFGRPRLVGSDGSDLAELQRHPKRAAVLIYLACRAKSPICPRETLLPVFWPESDEARARNALRQSLHVLRRITGNGIVNGRGDGHLVLDRAQLSCDVLDFREARSLRDWERCLELHAGDFLSDFHVANAGFFTDWADRERRGLKEKAVDSARRLAETAEVEARYAEALAWWQRALELSPHDEDILCSLVWGLSKDGNRAVAFETWQAFKRRLWQDLELEPSLSTSFSVGRALAFAGLAKSGRPTPRWLRAPKPPVREGQTSQPPRRSPGAPGSA